VVKNSGRRIRHALPWPRAQARPSAFEPARNEALATSLARGLRGHALFSCPSFLTTTVPTTPPASVRRALGRADDEMAATAEPGERLLAGGWFHRGGGKGRFTIRFSSPAPPANFSRTGNNTPRSLSCCSSTAADRWEFSTRRWGESHIAVLGYGPAAHRPLSGRTDRSTTDQLGVAGCEPGEHFRCSASAAG